MVKIEISSAGGNCPVQIEGTLDGVNFYFRARGQHWSLEVGPDPFADDAWRLERKYSDQPYAAGWMELATAERLLAAAAELWAAETAPKEDE